MGTPEFPNLGNHCSLQDCKQIDFLPFTCDLCSQVFCLEHRSYAEHSCPKANTQDVTVVICPLCAKGVRLNPEEDPNITWETHVNTECDPSNYEKVAKKRKCPVLCCREVLTFSNTIKCRDCGVDHCLKHRFGPDHNCPGPNKKLDLRFQFLSLLNRSKKEESEVPVSTPSSPQWTTSFLNAASTVRASAEAGMSKLSSEISQAWLSARNGASSRGTVGIGHVECPQCGARFSSVTTTSSLEQEQRTQA
ncbi:stress-associated protein [Turnera subulata]|uniref:Stress-associated protein n=1 Tax=Turnera subulata TaxID=218843 RepID=A0A9Q0J0T8_9ROSI|nr:stress-associated protein [Turnera subulata]